VITTVLAATQKEYTTISLTIINSYSGSSQAVGTGYQSGSVLYVTSPVTTVQLSATTGSWFSLSGDLAETTTGAGSGAYTLTTPITLSTGDGLKQITTEFLKGDEPYLPDQLYYYLDTTGPTTPLINNIYFPYYDEDRTIVFDRSGGIDLGVGVASAKLHISNQPDFSPQGVYTTTGESFRFSGYQL
jgi:hypothetical protein